MADYGSVRARARAGRRRDAAHCGGLQREYSTTSKTSLGATVRAQRATAQSEKRASPRLLTVGNYVESLRERCGSLAAGGARAPLV